VNQLATISPGCRAVPVRSLPGRRLARGSRGSPLCRGLLALLLAPLWLAARPAAAQPENFLILLVDDVGVEKIGAYDFWSSHGFPQPITPRIDQLAAEGVRFRNVWANPVCSPTRALALSGEHGFRTGIGTFIGASAADYSLPTSGPPLLPQMLAPAGYSSAAIGKWHLAAVGLDQPTAHPLESGFDTHIGSIQNLDGERISNGVQSRQADFFSWKRLVDGSFPSAYHSVYADPFAPSPAGYQHPEHYATRSIANEVIARIDGDGSLDLPEPWLVYVAFHAAHSPFHIPPSNLSPESEVPVSGRLYELTAALSPAPTDAELHRAMLESLDFEIGRVLAALPPAVAARTTVIFASDNGTANGAAEAPYTPQRVKESLFEGGIRVPFIVKSPRLAAYAANRGKQSTAIASVADLFETVRDIADAHVAGVASGGGRDSSSLVPVLEDPNLGSAAALPDDAVRASVYAEVFRRNGLPSPEEQALPAQLGNPLAPVFQRSYERAIRDTRYKLIREQGRDARLYDLASDPLEVLNLIDSPAHAAIRDDLVARMDALVGIPRCGGRNDIDGDLHCDDDDRCVLVPDSDPSPGAQADRDSDGYGDACDPDFDDSGRVSVADLNTFFQCFGKAVPAPGPGPAADPTCEESDLDASGSVLIQDFNLLRARFSQPPGPSGVCGFTGFLPACLSP